MQIQEFTRQLIIQDLIAIGCVSGTMHVSEFVRRVYPKANSMPTTDYRFGMKTAIDDIRQHMDNNNDWEYRADICCKFWSIPVIGGFKNESIGHNQADSEGIWNESE